MAEHLLGLPLKHKLRKLKDVDDSAIGNDKILVYKIASSKHVYESKPAGGGDMYKSTYDTDDNGVVDNSEKLEGSTKVQVQDHSPKAHTHPESEVTFDTTGGHKHDGVSARQMAHSELSGINPNDHHSSNQGLTNHSDVEITAPADAEVLTYESATSKWKNKSAPPPGAHADTHQTGGSDPLTPFTGDMTFNTKVGIGANPLPNKKAYLQLLASDIIGIDIDQEVNDFTSPADSYGIKLVRHGAVPASAVGYIFAGYDSLIEDYHNLADAEGASHNIYGHYIAARYLGAISGFSLGCIPYVFGVRGLAEFKGSDISTGSPSVYVRGLEFFGNIPATAEINKPSGTTKLVAEGIFTRGLCVPTLTAGNVEIEARGIKCEAFGKTGAGITSVAYGVYTRAINADQNYDFYGYGSNGSLRLKKITSVPTDAPDEATMRFFDDGATRRIYVYLGGQWRFIDLGATVLQHERGRFEVLNAPKNYSEYAISFPSSFAAVPRINVSIEVPSAETGNATCGIVQGTITTTGFTAFIVNNTGGVCNFYIQWVAVAQ